MHKSRWPSDGSKELLHVSRCFHLLVIWLPATQFSEFIFMAFLCSPNIFHVYQKLHLILLLSNATLSPPLKDCLCCYVQKLFNCLSTLQQMVELIELRLVSDLSQDPSGSSYIIPPPTLVVLAVTAYFQGTPHLMCLSQSKCMREIIFSQFMLLLQGFKQK